MLSVRTQVMSYLPMSLGDANMQLTSQALLQLLIHTILETNKLAVTRPQWAYLQK